MTSEYLSDLLENLSTDLEDIADYIRTNLIEFTTLTDADDLDPDDGDDEEL